MYEQPTAGRRFGPAMIAFLVVLAITAGVVGYFGARRVLGLGDPAQTNGQPGATTPAGSPAEPEPGKTDDDEETGNPPATTPQTTPKPTVAPGDGTRCPSVTENALRDLGVNHDLTVLLYVEAKARKAGDSNAEVWICQNEDGVLIYQGHVLAGPLGNANVSLLLVDGVKGTVVPLGTGYLATNISGTRKTTYLVNREELVRTDPGGGVVIYDVVRALPSS